MIVDAPLATCDRNSISNCCPSSDRRSRRHPVLAWRETTNDGGSAQRAISKRASSTVVEVQGSHAAVADRIAKAANGMALATR